MPEMTVTDNNIINLFSSHVQTLCAFKKANSGVMDSYKRLKEQFSKKKTSLNVPPPPDVVDQPRDVYSPYLASLL